MHTTGGRGRRVSESPRGYNQRTFSDRAKQTGRLLEIVNAILGYAACAAVAASTAAVASAVVASASAAGASASAASPEG